MIKCFKCNYSDQIQKVSAIYSAGISSGSYYGSSTPLGESKPSFTTVSGSSQSLLSRRLAPPNKPSPSFMLIVLDVVLAGFAIFCIILPCLFLLVLIYVLSYKPKVDQSKKEDKERLAKEIPLWETAMERWNRLYYCMRDDVVFDPDTEASFRPEEMMNYLYSAN